MKTFALLTLSALAAATPIQTGGETSRLAPRRTGIIAKEFSEGGCRDNIFIFSRGSTEPGNMGIIAGPPTSDGLKAALGEDAVATEGVDYGALLSTNFLPGGADPAGTATMRGLVEAAAARCPDATLLVGGYSQGAAMVHRVVEDLGADVQARVAGVVTFGDTQNAQDGGQIDGFDPAKTKVLCNPGDAVCVGTLNILPPHLDYTRRAPEAVDFLVQQAQGAAAAARKRRSLVARGGGA
ncbi:cutinase-2 [Xylariomycetidae sp. FL0641]|nr:cutinase-2 [Xylariomycetidae sp. FL0641]